MFRASAKQLPTNFNIFNAHLGQRVMTFGTKIATHSFSYWQHKRFCWNLTNSQNCWKYTWWNEINKLGDRTMVRRLSDIWIIFTLKYLNCNVEEEITHKRLLQKYKFCYSSPSLPLHRPRPTLCNSVEQRYKGTVIQVQSAPTSLKSSSRTGCWTEENIFFDTDLSFLHPLP